MPEQDEPKLTEQREKLLAVLADHRHLYDRDCNESFGCSCGWTQQPGVLDIVLITDNENWKDESLTEQIFHRHLAEAIEKGLSA